IRCPSPARVTLLRWSSSNSDRVLHQHKLDSMQQNPAAAQAQPESHPHTQRFHENRAREFSAASHHGAPAPCSARELPGRYRVLSADATQVIPPPESVGLSRL